MIQWYWRKWYPRVGKIRQMKGNSDGYLLVWLILASWLKISISKLLILGSFPRCFGLSQRYLCSNVGLMIPMFQLENSVGSLVVWLRNFWGRSYLLLESILFWWKKSCTSCIYVSCKYEKHRYPDIVLYIHITYIYIYISTGAEFLPSIFFLFFGEFLSLRRAPRCGSLIGLASLATQRNAGSGSAMFWGNGVKARQSGIGYDKRWSLIWFKWYHMI